MEMVRVSRPDKPSCFCPACTVAECRMKKYEKLKNAIKEIKTGAVYGSANSQHFLHNIFEDIIKICNEAIK